MTGSYPDEFRGHSYAEELWPHLKMLKHVLVWLASSMPVASRELMFWWTFCLFIDPVMAIKQVNSIIFLDIREELRELREFLLAMLFCTNRETNWNLQATLNFTFPAPNDRRTNMCVAALIQGWWGFVSFPHMREHTRFPDLNCLPSFKKVSVCPHWEIYVYLYVFSHGTNKELNFHNNKWMLRPLHKENTTCPNLE